MRRLAAALLLLTAGCVVPGADLGANSVAPELRDITLEGATSEVLANGDVLLTIVGEVAGSETFTFDVPEGVTYVEAEAVGGEEGRVSVVLVDEEMSMSLCRPHRWTGWNQVGDTARCTAVAAANPGRAWTANVGGGLFSATPLDGLPVGLPVAPGREVTPVPFTLKLTFSTQPLDGSAALLKLDALSRPTFDALEMEVLEVPASADGVALHVELTRPDTEAKVPIMLQASPYNGPSQNAQGRAGGAWVDYWVARGYAAAVMDLRGTGKSDGCFAMRSVLDQTDVADVVEFLGGEEWSNGKVGMQGTSYVGYTPVAAAVQQPEHLAAISINAPAIDTWSNYLPGGVDTGRSFSTVLGYSTGNAALTPSDELPPDSILHTIDAFCDPTIFPRANEPRHLYDEWYAERNLTERVADINVPVMLGQGFWDNNVKANLVPDFFNALTVEKRALFGSWEHTWALRADESVRQLAWFDQFLKGIDTGILETPVVEVLTNDRQWRAADAWPEPTPTYTDLELGGGSLVAHPPATASMFDNALATEVPLDEALYLSGVPLVTMDLTLPTGGVPILEARLYEQPAEGDRIFAGVGWINGAHLDGHTTFMPLAPGETRSVEMKLLPQDHVFRAGSTLVLELRAATDSWGGPESALGAPTSIEVSAATLRVPTLPTSALSVAPRSTA